MMATNRWALLFNKFKEMNDFKIYKLNSLFLIKKSTKQIETMTTVIKLTKTIKGIFLLKQIIVNRRRIKN